MSPLQMKTGAVNPKSLWRSNLELPRVVGIAAILFIFCEQMKPVRIIIIIRFYLLSAPVRRKAQVPPGRGALMVGLA